MSVRQETKDKITAAVKELDYKPNLVARGLRSNTMHNIAVLVSDISNPFSTEVFKGAQKAAHEKGYTLTLFDTEDNTQRELEYIDMIARSLSDGVLLTSVYIDDAIIEEIEKSEMKYILVNRSLREQSGMLVTVDDIKGIRLAVRHLYEKGHRRIAHITGPLYTSSGINRLGSFRETMRELGLECPPGYVVESTFHSITGKRAMRNILALPNRPSGIVAGNDLIAIGALSAAYEAGLRVPEDISIVGFDDIWISEVTVPALTTVSCDKKELGYLAANLLIGSIENKLASEDKVNFLDVRLIERGSVSSINNQ